MADEIVSKLGLDASDVINTLNQLATGFLKYTNAMAENAGGAANFNSAQKQFVDLLARIEAQARLTAGAIKDLNGGVANSGKQLAAAAAAQSNQNAATAASTLGGQFDKSKATPEQLTGFTAALQTFQTKAAKAGLDANTLNQIVGQTGQTFSGAAAGVNQAALNVTKLGQAFGQVPAQVNNATQATNNFNFSIGRLFDVFAFQVLLRGVGALTGALTQAIPEAIAFEKQIAAIATISDSSDKNLQVLSNRIIGLANEFGKPAAEVAAGFYQTLSNQVGNTDQSIQFFNESLKLARATLGSTGDAVNALSGIQLSYGQSAAQASHNADILFATVDLGRVSLKELGDSLGRLNPLASQLGINTEFVAGAISLATQKGVNFRDAQTQILNLFTASLKPTTDFRKRLDELGFATTEAGIAALGAAGFFAKIGEGASTSTELAKLFPNIRGLRGEISLFADGGKKLNEILDDISQRAGAAQRAFETIQFTNAVNVEGELNRVKNILIAGFGHDALAALAAVNIAFGGFANTIAIVAGTLAGLAVLGTTVVVFNQLAAAVTVAATALSAAATISFGAAAAAIVVGTGGIALALAAAVAGFIALRAAIAESDIVAATAAKFEKVRAEVDKNATAQAEAVRATQADEVKAVQANVAIVIGAEAQKQQAFIQASNVAKELQKADSTSFDSELNIRLKAFTQFQNSIKTLETNQAQNTLKLQEDQRKTEIGIREAQFQRFNAQFGEQRQASNLQTQFARLQGQANTAFQKGDINVGNDILGILGGIAKQYADITGKSQLENQFINLSRIATQKKIDLGDQAVAQARALEAANQPILDEARRQVELAQILTKELDKVPAGDTQRKAALEQQIIQIAQGIDKLGGKLTLGNLKVGDIRTTDIQNISDALKKATGGISLAFSAQKGFDKLRADTKAAFDAQPLVAKLGFQFDEKGFADAQKKAQDLLKASTAGFEAAQALPGLKDQTKAATDNVNDTFTNLISIIQKAAHEGASAGDILAGLIDPKKIPEIVQLLTGIKDRVREFRNGVDEILNNPLNFDEDGHLTTSALKAIGTLKSNLTGAFQDANLNKFLSTDSVTNFQAAINATISSVENLTKDIQAQREAQVRLDEATGARAKLQNGANNAPQLQDIQNEEAFDKAIKDAADSARNLQTINTQVAENAIADIGSQVQSLGVLERQTNVLGQTGFTAGEEAAIGIDQIGVSAISQIPAIFSLITALEELAAAEASAGGGGGSFANRGGMTFFANGGIAPRGHDTVPAMLTPGEIVMNPSSSRKFFSQLMAMNAGATPTFNQNGGGVSNTFGDIHVNVAGGASGIDGREIATAIRRELRRGTTKL